MALYYYSNVDVYKRQLQPLVSLGLLQESITFLPIACLEIPVFYVQLSKVLLYLVFKSILRFPLFLLPIGFWNKVCFVGYLSSILSVSNPPSPVYFDYPDNVRLFVKMV